MLDKILERGRRRGTIGIHEADQRSMRLRKAESYRAALANAPGFDDDADARVVFGNITCNLFGAISRTIDNDQQFDVIAISREEKA